MALKNPKVKEMKRERKKGRQIILTRPGKGPLSLFPLKKNCCIGLIYNVAEFGNILFLRFPLVIAYYIFHCYF